MAGQVVLMMLLGTSTIVYGIRKDEDMYEVREDEKYDALAEVDTMRQLEERQKILEAEKELNVLIDQERQKILKAEKELSVLIDRRVKHANHAYGDCDGDDCDGDCEDVAEACGLRKDALNRSAFYTCCTSAEWTCEEGKCKHSNRACLAAADELFYEDGERDCSAAIDLVKYHWDHADNDLEESIMSGVLERDLDGTVLAKGGKGGSDDDDDDDESLQQSGPAVNHSMRTKNSVTAQGP